MGLPIGAAPVDAAFTKSLPKAELHAHLSGSISVQALHQIWQLKSSRGECLSLNDPALALKPAGSYPTVSTFFQIFNDYIYTLVNDEESLSYATRSVVQDFARDGVKYLELRTTPRAVGFGGKREYVGQVLEALKWNWEVLPEGDMEAQLILSIDRGMTAEEAMDVVEIALQHRSVRGKETEPHVVGIDLCGNPTKGDVQVFTPAFRKAKEAGLGITVHFAEVPASSSEAELRTLLDWQPDRLGHAIHIPSALKEIIRGKKIGLELCLSCNVLAKLTDGGFRQHHFGEWRHSGCPIALGTDDVGIFESTLSNEYFIAASEFSMERNEIIGLARKAVDGAFTGRERMMGLLDAFEIDMVRHQ